MILRRTIQKTLLLMFLSISSLFGIANAKDGVYLSTFAGLGLSGYKSSQRHLGAAIGYNYHNYSFDFSYTNIHRKTASQFYLVNAFYNINNLHNRVKPYIGIGFGYNSSPPDLLLASRFVAGSKFNVNKNIQLFADYRYTITSLPLSLNALHSGNIGVSYLF